MKSLENYLNKIYPSMDEVDIFEDGEYVFNSPQKSSILLKNFNQESLKIGKILVCFSAAVSNRKQKVGPFYSGVGLSEILNIPLISFSDYPVTNNENLSLAWYCGCEENIDFQDKIAKILDKISTFYSCELILLGGSGGGFASLAIASKIKSNAFVVSSNPQISVCNYIERHVENYINIAFKSELDKSCGNSKNIFEKYNITYDVSNALYGENIKILYLINLDDQHHINNHLSYFIQNKEILGYSENIYKFNKSGLYFGCFGSGHSGPTVQFLSCIINDICLGCDIDAILMHIKNGLSGLIPKSSNKIALISSTNGRKEINII